MKFNAYILLIFLIFGFGKSGSGQESEKDVNEIAYDSLISFIYSDYFFIEVVLSHYTGPDYAFKIEMDDILYSSYDEIVKKYDLDSADKKVLTDFVSDIVQVIVAHEKHMETVQVSYSKSQLDSIEARKAIIDSIKNIIWLTPKVQAYITNFEKSSQGIKKITHPSR